MEPGPRFGGRALLVWASAPDRRGRTRVRDAAAKFLTAARFVTDRLLIGQGEALLDEFKSILDLMDPQKIR